ncbi:PTS sugar transporter subunit IIB [Breznakia pachnodae]|uniref:PTS system mannose-specific IIB component n=1 Tax=Breznakia pachnodae TaxID=265178 RepID=A0ABU0E8F8_9FIRM|nr:PTS sugar transporter subunit IIB [Breznakia pachnodae]MDQ0363182.1 PTS system mannose-specific IIB component [Breznakia pachnodae]
MDIVLGRLDNRLLHGIIATQWAQHTKCERLMIIDDEVAADPQKKEIMKMARPVGIPLSIITLDTAIENFKADKYKGKRVFVVAKKPETFSLLLDNGITMAELNIGGSGYLSDEIIKLSNRYSCTKKDQEFLNKIKSDGVYTYIQYVPADTKVEY